MSDIHERRDQLDKELSALSWSLDNSTHELPSIRAALKGMHVRVRLERNALDAEIKAAEATKTGPEAIADALAGPMQSVLTDRRVRLLRNAVETYNEQFAELVRASDGRMLVEESEDLKVLNDALNLLVDRRRVGALPGCAQTTVPCGFASCGIHSS